MRLLLLLIFLATPFALATQEIVTPRVRVLFDDPALEPHAQRIANEAERALDALAPLFGSEPERITLTIDDLTDVYNATATALPRPKVALRALFPTDVELGLRTEDDLYLLLLHELTHNLQFSYTERPEGAGEPLRLGVVGEGVAAVPPPWFVEGLATWAESTYTEGGRVGDALTTGLLESAALEGDPPTLTEASLATYSGWPGNLTRYLYGAAFVDHLVETRGFEAVLETLRVYNANGPLRDFSDAWAEAVGTELEEEWGAWLETLEERAEARAGSVHAGETLTKTGWYTRAPAVSPDGSKVAWLSWPPSVVVADLVTDPGEGAGLENRRTLISERFLTGLAWLDADTLLYARPVPRPGRTLSELFALDIHTGEERQLTRGARAKRPSVTPKGCVLYVRDVVTERSKVQRWCDGTTDTLLTLPEGEHVVGLAVSEGGRVALSVWRGGFVDLALLEEDELIPLTQDAAQDLDPAWRGEEALVFRSDREPGGVFDLFELTLENSSLSRLTRTLGGAFEPAASPAGLLYAELGAEGYSLALLETPLDVDTPFAFEPLQRRERSFTHYEVRPYSPFSSLRPYGWLPDNVSVGSGPIGVSLGASVLGQDDSGRHSYRLSFGYDGERSGLLEGVYANARYDFAAAGTLTTPSVTPPFGVGVQLGLWPHTPHAAPWDEVALGVKGFFTARVPLDTWNARVGLEVGALYLESFGALQPDGRLTATLSRGRTDPYGYPTRGVWTGLTGVVSATGEGLSPGAWLDGRYYRSAGAVGLPGTLEFAARAGYRIALLVPRRFESDWGGLFTAGYHTSLPLGWRYGDGLYAVERLSFEPRARVLWDGGLTWGGDLTVSLDALLNYSAPVSLSGTLGYAEGFWYRFGVRLPL